MTGIPTATVEKAARLVAGAVLGGASSMISGGEFGQGFMSAGLGTLAGTQFGNGPGGFVTATVVGGTISEMTGGKFRNGAASAAFAYAMSWAASKYGTGPQDTDNRKVGECKEYGRCMPDDFSEERRTEVLKNIKDKSSHLVGKSYGSGDEGIKAAALALHGSDLVAYSRELGVEFYAVIDKNGVITEVSTAFKYAEASWGNSKFGDSIWHTHPAGSDLNNTDVVTFG